jgi:predicted RNA-binding Zn-ribbon protein involved in translation (DUF1610 family)
MDTLQLPRCPKCADGGIVRLVEISRTENVVFKPLPEGWRETVHAFQCECGWSTPTTDGERQTTTK